MTLVLAAPVESTDAWVLRRRIPLAQSFESRKFFQLAVARW